MGRVLWFVGAGILGLVLLVAFRGQAAASEAGSCSQVDGFLSFCINVPTAGVRRETTVPLVSLPSERADVRVEVTVSGSDALALAVDVDRSVERVETLFGRTFSARPRVLVFGTNNSFAKGAAELFGYSSDTASYVASTYGGIFDRGTMTIALNRSSAGGAHAGPAIAHELTHLMIREVAGGREIPVWLDEGIAVLVEGDIAAVATPMLSFDELATVADFHRTYARVGNAAYEFSAAAATAMEARIGWSGVVRVLGAVGEGTPFDVAYVGAARETVSTLESRVRTAGISVGALDASGNVTWTLATNTPGAEVHVSITGGRAYSVTFTVTTDGLGMYRGTFGSTAAPGTYTVDAAGAVATFSTARYRLAPR